MNENKSNLIACFLVFLLTHFFISCENNSSTNKIDTVEQLKVIKKGNTFHLYPIHSMNLNELIIALELDTNNFIPNFEYNYFSSLGYYNQKYRIYIYFRTNETFSILDYDKFCIYEYYNKQISGLTILDQTIKKYFDINKDTLFLY